MINLANSRDLSTVRLGPLPAFDGIETPNEGPESSLARRGLAGKVTSLNLFAKIAASPSQSEVNLQKSLSYAVIGLGAAGALCYLLAHLILDPNSILIPLGLVSSWLKPLFAITTVAAVSSFCLGMKHYSRFSSAFWSILEAREILHKPAYLSR